MTPTLERPCEYCGGPNRRRHGAKYCSTRCGQRAAWSPRAAVAWRARARGAEIIEAVDPAVIAERDGGACYLCGEPVSRGQSGRWDATLDHVTPISKGGEHSYANVRLAHRSCNSRKRDSLIEASALTSPWSLSAQAGGRGE